MLFIQSQVMMFIINWFATLMGYPYIVVSSTSIVGKSLSAQDWRIIEFLPKVRIVKMYKTRDGTSLLISYIYVI